MNKLKNDGFVIALARYVNNTVSAAKTLSVLSCGLWSCLQIQLHCGLVHGGNHTMFPVGVPIRGGETHWSLVCLNWARMHSGTQIFGECVGSIPFLGSVFIYLRGMFALLKNCSTQTCHTKCLPNVYCGLYRSEQKAQIILGWSKTLNENKEFLASENLYLLRTYILLHICVHMCINIPNCDHLLTLDRKDKQSSLENMNLELWETGSH